MQAGMSMRDHLIAAIFLVGIAAPSGFASSDVSTAQPEPTQALFDALSDYRSGAYEEAYLGLLTLAHLGSAPAEAMLSTMFASGRGVRQDQRTAVLWCLRSAQRGYGPAQIKLATHYFKGQGVERDVVAAYGWALVAAKRSNPQIAKIARARAAQIGQSLDAEDRGAADRWSRSWRPMWTSLS
jgi:TPR repeat protein